MLPHMMAVSERERRGLNDKTMTARRGVFFQKRSQGIVRAGGRSARWKINDASRRLPNFGAEGGEMALWFCVTGILRSG